MTNTVPPVACPLPEAVGIPTCGSGPLARLRWVTWELAKLWQARRVERRGPAVAPRQDERP